MKKKNFWITLSLINLSIVALLGVTLRTKLLFPLPIIDFKNFLSAHSHFAFGGWVTLVLMVLYIDSILTHEQQQKKIYQWILWGIEINSIGMLITFPFQGYAFLSILFSTMFIVFTYAFTWVYIKDLRQVQLPKPTKLLTVVALVSLVVSSIGPFTLAYILATKTGDAILYRDSIYTYLHFQYNGFFTCSVFALLLSQVVKKIDERLMKTIKQFAVLLCLSVIPTLFLSMLWHAYNPFIRGVAIAGCALALLTLAHFVPVAFNRKLYAVYSSPLSRTLLVFSVISFIIKMTLQMGTIVPRLGNAVFGYRPIIIGFLHLVFLGFVTFYVISHFWSDGVFANKKRFSKVAIVFFAAAIIFSEAILLADGIGLMFYTTNSAYVWLLWVASIFLFTGAILILAARLNKISKNKSHQAMAFE